MSLLFFLIGVEFLLPVAQRIADIYQEILQQCLHRSVETGRNVSTRVYGGSFFSTLTPYFHVLLQEFVLGLLRTVSTYNSALGDGD